MTEILINRFCLAQEALSTAISNNLGNAVDYFDRQIDTAFHDILEVTPTDMESRRSLLEFLMDYCCPDCVGEQTALSARRKIIELMSQNKSCLN